MRTDILSTIWETSPGDFVFLPAKNSWTGEWLEGGAEDKLVVEPLEYNPELDLYFTPGTYRTRTGARQETNHAPMGVLYADLDDEFNRQRLTELAPSLLMETSHGMYQAVWLLTDPLPVDEAKDLNRRLSNWLDADYGSWIITKVLRIPGSMNWKRGGQRVEVVIWDPSLRRSPDLLDLWLPPAPKPSTLSVDVPHPPLPTSAQSRATINRLFPRFDHRTKELLTIYHPQDRSLFLARSAKRLADCGLTPEEIFVVLYNHPANKFRSRPNVLWESVILSAFSV